jgi:acetyl esterase/lipase
LQRAGVPTTLREFPGMIHGFVKRWDTFDDAQNATKELGTYLRKTIGPDR